MSKTPKSINFPQPRSHGGCQTCKIRKVKCDETRPICHRCESTGRKCDGYQQIQSLRLSLLNSPKELRSYHYFWNRVLPGLSGHYDQLFWGTWIRQATFSDLAIQHAVIAVGAIHESIASRFAANTYAATQLQCFAIQQYHKSIQFLNGNACQPPPIELILVNCIVFIAFENLCGRNDEAHKHLRSGLAILQSWKTTTTSQTFVKEEYLGPIFTRGYGHKATSDISMVFSDIQGARKCFQMLLDSIYSSISSSTIIGNRQRLDSDILDAQNILEEWYGNFAKLGQSKDLEQRRANILLRLQFETAFILIASISFESECNIDKYHDKFEIIIDQCEQLVGLEDTLAGKSDSDTKVFTYSFDLSILPPLNIAALKCRDPAIRRKAIKLMSTGDRYEGLWSGKTLGQIAQKTMDTEDAGLFNVNARTDQPGSSRLKLVGLSYNPDARFSTSRSTALPYPVEAHYNLEWHRVMPNSEIVEVVDGYLPISAEDILSPWGPGRHAWHMDLHYDSTWAGRKTPDHSQDVSPSSSEHRTTSEPSAATNQSSSSQAICASVSPMAWFFQAHSAAIGTSSSARVRQQQPVNLFWDHWRLRTVSVRHGRAAAVEMEKEATRGAGDMVT